MKIAISPIKHQSLANVTSKASYTRTAAWILQNEKKSTCHKVLTFVIVFFASFILTASLVGIYPLLKCYKEYIILKESEKSQVLLQKLKEIHSQDVKKITYASSLKEELLKRKSKKNYLYLIKNMQALRDRVKQEKKRTEDAENTLINSYKISKKLLATIAFQDNNIASLREKLASSEKTLEIERFTSSIEIDRQRKKVHKYKHSHHTL